VLIHYSLLDNDSKNSKVIFFLQYEKGFTSTHKPGDFYHESSKALSSFSLAGVTWTQYETNMDTNFEVSSQNYSPNEVKKFLESLDLTSK
jgi:hypothetical protein